MQENLSHCHSLSVLYLYNNLLDDLTAVGVATSLTHLYLQNNRIERIHGLDRLGRLEKL